MNTNILILSSYYKVTPVPPVSETELLTKLKVSGTLEDVGWDYYQENLFSNLEQAFLLSKKTKKFEGVIAPSTLLASPEVEIICFDMTEGVLERVNPVNHTWFVEQVFVGQLEGFVVDSRGVSYPKTKVSI